MLLSQLPFVGVLKDIGKTSIGGRVLNVTLVSLEFPKELKAAIVYVYDVLGSKLSKFKYVTFLPTLAISVPFLNIIKPSSLSELSNQDIVAE